MFCRSVVLHSPTALLWFNDQQPVKNSTARRGLAVDFQLLELPVGEPGASPTSEGSTRKQKKHILKNQPVRIAPSSPPPPGGWLHVLKARPLTDGRCWWRGLDRASSSSSSSAAICWEFDRGAKDRGVNGREMLFAKIKRKRTGIDPSFVMVVSYWL